MSSNEVDLTEACPKCGERDSDFLEWQEPEEGSRAACSVLCLTCGTYYEVKE